MNDDYFVFHDYCLPDYCFFSRDSTIRGITTCKVAAPNSNTEVLGAAFGDDEAIEAQFRETSEKAQRTQSTIRLVEDAACELVLTRRCTDVCKVTHLLRTSGDRLSRQAPSAFDPRVRLSLEHVIGSPLSEDSYLRASLGVSDGGLGFRRATGIETFFYPQLPSSTFFYLLLPSTTFF